MNLVHVRCSYQLAKFLKLDDSCKYTPQRHLLHSQESPPRVMLLMPGDEVTPQEALRVFKEELSCLQSHFLMCCVSQGKDEGQQGHVIDSAADPL